MSKPRFLIRLNRLSRVVKPHGIIQEGKMNEAKLDKEEKEILESF